MEEFSKIESLENFNPKGKILQGGIGYYALCRDCNSFLGSNYVRSYELWVKSGMEVLSAGNFESAKYIAINQSPLKIIKQIISMFIVINDDVFHDAYPELINFVNDPNSNSLSDKFKLFLYLNNEGNYRYCKLSTIMIPGIAILNCTELAFPPFGYVLTIDFGGIIPRMLNITDFKNFTLQTTGKLGLGLYRLPTYLPFPPLDYRAKEKIELDIKTGNELRDRINKQGE